jgi:hypothetical protein
MGWSHPHCLSRLHNNITNIKSELNGQKQQQNNNITNIKSELNGQKQQQQQQ